MAGTFYDSVMQVTWSGRALNFVRQNCQLVRDPLLNWQPLQLVQQRLGMGMP